MPWCQCRPRFAPVIYVLFFYAMYMLMVFPVMELLGYGMKILMGIDIGTQSSMTRWVYGICLFTFVPCYLIIFYSSWVKHRAKPLFTPKWKTNEPMEEDDVQCTICYDLIVDPRTLRCQHSFCKKCIDQCLPLTRRCPSCQQWVYWSRKNKLFKSKVLLWVREQGREEEYEEVLKIKADIKPPKYGCWTRFWPLVLPFFEVPERENQRRLNGRRRRRHMRGAVVEPVPAGEPDSLIVRVVDEVEEDVSLERPPTPVPPPLESPDEPSVPFSHSESIELSECIESPEISESSIEPVESPTTVSNIPEPSDPLLSSSSSLSSVHKSTHQSLDEIV
ncbi:hypothetical protein GCK72_009390 [Caenorhabditis remanei]|uniref:RING-type domain-containing protein n=1 Tax=Caenorhabditis remanei TaxID=31234 RepID=A0A6A5H2S7_CAERE|nr:hypothetical protein GCK72_009390 [Caenorhabditis remanei]KAF1761136.1 hypothetical protein GCK72_009390 [Caenorhabditis remanei]